MLAIKLDEKLLDKFIIKTKKFTKNINALVKKEH